jgi:hypothetical protein
MARVDCAYVIYLFGVDDDGDEDGDDDDDDDDDDDADEGSGSRIRDPGFWKCSLVRLVDVLYDWL